MGKRTIPTNPVDWLAALSSFITFLVENDIYGYEGSDPYGGYTVYVVDDSRTDIRFATPSPMTWDEYEYFKEFGDVLSHEPVQNRTLHLNNYWTYVGDTFVFGITYGLERQYRIFAYSNAVIFPVEESHEL